MFSANQQLARANASFMSRVYLWMMIGLALSGITAYTLASSPSAMMALMSHRFGVMGIIVLQIGAVLCLSAFINRMSAMLTTSVYLAYSLLSGITLSLVCISFTGASVAEAFFITAFGFVGLSAFGLITKRDLGPLGTFCMTGLFGLIGFVLITMLFPSIRTTAVNMTINTLGLLIFAGLTAYDTQKIKSLNMSGFGGEIAHKAAISGALMLYLDFINIFLNVLNLLGNRR